MYQEVPCIPHTTTPQTSFVDEFIQGGAHFLNHVVYHHSTTPAAEHSAIVAQAALDIHRDTDSEAYSSRVTIEQSFEDNGNKMVTRFGQPVNQVFAFVMKGKGNARSHAQSP
jgi:hypothetical protein